MREMKDSGVEWLGEVPAGWEVDRLGSFFASRNQKVSDEDYPALSVTMGGVVPQLSHVAKSDDHANRKLVCEGDFVINSRSDRRNSCGFAYQDGSVSLINTICIPRKEMEPRYFGFLFDTSQWADEFYAWGHGIVSDLWTTGWNDMKKILLPVPPLDEQRRIADFLDEKCAQIDRAITSAEQSIQEYKAYKSSLISFSLPRKRTLVPIKQLCDLLPGYAFESQKFIKGDDGVRLLRGINVGVGKTQWLDIVSYPTDMLGGLDAYELSSGDLVIGLDRPWIKDGLRTTFITEDDLPCYLVQRVARIRVRGNLYAPYLKHCLDSGLLERHIASGTTGVSVPHISHFQIASCKIPLSPLDEQRRIAGFLDEKCAQIDRAVEAKQAIIDELKSYKKSLIYEVVTGKREV